VMKTRIVDEGIKWESGCKIVMRARWEDVA
jgi:hypothetical protein